MATIEFSQIAVPVFGWPVAGAFDMTCTGSRGFACTAAGKVSGRSEALIGPGPT